MTCVRERKRVRPTACSRPCDGGEVGSGIAGEDGAFAGEWLALTIREGPPTEKERREWLKKEHKLGTNSAAWIAERADGKGTEEDSPEAYLEAAVAWVDAQYSGPRAALRPLYEQLLKLALALGKEAKASPGRRGFRSTGIMCSQPLNRRRIRALMLGWRWAI